MGTRPADPPRRAVRYRGAVTSDLFALLPEGCLIPSAESVVERLMGGLDGTLAAVTTDEFIEGATWTLMLAVDDDPIGLIALVPSEGDVERFHLAGREVTEHDLSAANRSPASLLITVDPSELHPVSDFHRQVRIVAAAAPEAQLVIDSNACAMHPRGWLWEIAECPVPPPPRALMTIHSVFDPDQPDAGCWLHSHGLRRYGCDEIEAMAVPQDRAPLVADVLNRIAERLLEDGPPPPKEEWSIGHDLDVLWRPWEDALALHPAGSSGGPSDREDVHGQPSMLFLVPSRSWLPWRRGPRPVHELLDRMSEHPVFWVTNTETRRMEALAQLRWPRFVALAADHVDSDWVFLAKVGYPTDDGSSREHLWFEVHSVTEDDFDGTCLNAPYDVEHLSEGHRGRHALGLVSHWQVGHPDHGSFDPDSVRHLLRVLEG
jgi:hypothetical protein